MTLGAGAQPPPAGDRVGWRTTLLLALAALAFFLPGRASLPPVDRDESRYLQATRQMLQTHDFVQIRFQDQPRNLQPVGIYWLEAVAAQPFGADRAPVWAYRLPSLLAAVLAVLLTCRVGTSLFGREAGVGAAVMLMASALLSFESRMAKIDACLLADILTAQGALLHAYLGRVRGRGRGNAAVFWAAMGVGLLLKGPIPPIVSGTTVAVLVLTDRDRTWLKRLHAGWGWLLALAIALPWFVAIGVKTHGAFFDKAVRQNFLGKVGRGEQHHGQPPGYYLALFSLTFWPGALASVLALPWIWRSRTTPAVRFCLAWIIPTWIMYEAVGTKLPHYVLPLYPALACLGAGAALAKGGWTAGRTGRIAAAVYAVLWLTVGVVLAAAGPALAWRYLHRVDSALVAADAVAVALCTAALVFVARGARGPALALAAAGAFLIEAGLYAYVFPSLQPIWLGPRIAKAAEAVQPCPTSELLSTRFAEPSLVFSEKNRTRLLGPAEAADRLAAAPACAVAAVSARQLDVFLGRVHLHGLALRQRGEVDGVDYSTGERMRVLLYTSAAAGAAAGPPSR